MTIEFEHDYREKIILQNFKETILEKKSDVLAWRAQWTKELSTWHSPYKCLVDCTQLTILNQEDFKEPLELMIKFFNGLFLRKIVGFGYSSEKNHDLLPFKVFSTEEEATKELGIRGKRQIVADDFRSQIQFENHFQQHVVELSFLAPIYIEDAKMLATLKSKMTNNLMHWHSAWSLLIDCTNLKINPELGNEFEQMTRFFKGFFLKEVIGYSPMDKEAVYPFPVYRSRHKAAGILTTETMISGNDANCQSRKG